MANKKNAKSAKKAKKNDIHKKLKKEKDVIVSGPSKYQVADCTTSSHQVGWDCLAGLASEMAMTEKSGFMWKSDGGESE